MIERWNWRIPEGSITIGAFHHRSGPATRTIIFDARSEGVETGICLERSGLGFLTRKRDGARRRVQVERRQFKLSE